MDENILIPFEYETNPIRVVRSEDGEPLFAASDVCKALDIANVGNALARLDGDERRDIRSMDVTGRQQGIWFVTESGLYSLILTSRKPEAKAFKRWITHEVLPAVRKTGQYTSQALTPLQQLEATVTVLRAQEAQLADHEQRINELESHTQSEPEHFTVLGYCRLRSLPVPSRNEAQSIGQRAAHLSKLRGRSVGKTSDPRYGTVNTYHVSILDELFGEKA